MDALRQERMAKGLSQEDLSDLSGVAQNTISDIETGRREPRPSTLRKLARSLGVEVADFFPKADPPLSPEEKRWLSYVNSLEEDELKELKAELMDEVERLTPHLTLSELRSQSVEQIDQQIEAMERLRRVKERLHVIDRKLAKT